MTIRTIVKGMWIVTIISIIGMVISVAPAEPVKTVTCTHVERGHCLGYGNE